MVDKQRNFVDKELIEQRLNQDILGYASQWLGQPSSVSANEARWGRKGSFSLMLNGPKTGLWHNWETDQKGKGLISLYMHCYDSSFKDSLKTLSQELRISSSSGYIMQKKEVSSLSVQDEWQASKIKRATSEYKKGTSIEGSIAEKYLRGRGIEGDLPKDFRYRSSMKHPFTKTLMPALVAPIRDSDGKLTGIVRIFLDKSGNKIDERMIDLHKGETNLVSKANLGVIGKGAVTVQKTNNSTLYIAEGIETALSISKALPQESVMASLSVSQLKNIPVPSNIKSIVICADNDGAKSSSYLALQKAVEHHLSQGMQVYVAMPSGLEKKDFNDLLKSGGIASVKSTLENRLEMKTANDLNMIFTLNLNTHKESLVKANESLNKGIER